MVRNEKPVCSDIEQLAAFASGLRQLRVEAGLTYPEMARRTGYTASALSRAAAGNDLPTWSVTQAYVGACGGDSDAWHKTWLAAKRTVEGRHGRLTGAGDTAEPASPPTTGAEFNHRLQQRIRSSGLTQRAIAAACNYSPTTLSSSLNSGRVASAELVVRVLRALSAIPVEIATWQAWRAQLVTPAAPTSPVSEPASETVSGPPNDVETSATPKGLTIRRLLESPFARILPWPFLAVLVAAGVSAVWIRFSSEPNPMEGHHGAVPNNPTPTTSPALPTRAQATDTDLRENTAEAASRPGGADRTTASNQAPETRPPPSTVRPAMVRVRLVRPASSFDEGRVLYLLCESTKTQGWYYTANGYYLQRSDFEYLDGGDGPIPPCDEVNFPEFEFPDDSVGSRPTDWTILRHPDLRTPQDGPVGYCEMAFTVAASLDSSMWMSSTTMSTAVTSRPSRVSTEAMTLARTCSVTWYTM